MKTWLTVSEYAKLVGLDESIVRQLVIDGNLAYKEENENIYIDASSATNAVVSHVSSEVIEQEVNSNSASFIEKTIGTILSLHEKVLDAKEETLNALKSENQFLRDALFSMQEIYEDDKKTIETLREQLRITQEELEFMKRKYKLMWGKVTEKNLS